MSPSIPHTIPPECEQWLLCWFPADFVEQVIAANVPWTWERLWAWDCQVVDGVVRVAGAMLVDLLARGEHADTLRHLPPVRDAQGALAAAARLREIQAELSRSASRYRCGALHSLTLALEHAARLAEGDDEESVFCWVHANFGVSGTLDMALGRTISQGVPRSALLAALRASLTPGAQE